MKTLLSKFFGVIVCFSLLFLPINVPLYGAGQPQWGERFSRNMVSSETNLPESWNAGRRDARTGQIDLNTTQNVRWVAPIGEAALGTPVVAEGCVLIGSNGTQSNRPQLQGDRGVLTCLDEKTGKLLWELVVPKLMEIRYADWYNVGIVSVPVVSESKVYVMTNRGEVACLDLFGMKNGNQGPFLDEAKHAVEPGMEPIELNDEDADILWLVDLVEEIGAQYHNATNCSFLLDGDLFYICTGNGTDWTHRRVMNPIAPTLIVMDKNSGKILAQDDFRLGPNIIHGQWSSPSLGVVNGRKLIFQGTGSGHLFAVDALSEEAAENARATGKIAKLNTVWKFNGHPLAQKQEVVPLEHFHDTKSYEVIGNPVFQDNRIYVAFTQEMFHNIPDGWFVCLDATKTGDTTRTGGLLWAYEGMSSSSSTAAVADGLVYIADGSGRLHCLDSDTGKPYWVQPLGGQVWGSPLVADGKVYLGTTGRKCFIFRHGKEMELISQITVPDRIQSSITAANGTLFVPMLGAIYAVEKNE